MNAISRRSLLARGGLLLAAGAAAVNTPVHALAANRQARSGNFKSINMAMEQAVRDGIVAGVVATAAGPDSMIYEGTFGKASTATGATMRADTVFWLLSMTKAFTATACMQLIEQGRINPEDDAAKYLPELANPMVLEGFDGHGQPRLRPAKRAIKVRHLLTHTSGYTYSIWSDALTRYENVTGMPDIATCKNGAFLAPLEFDPGERWQYGISMDWVGKLVEAVSDQSLEVYFRENIFAPLGMTDSGFLIGSKQKARVATFHNRREDGGLTPAPFEMPQRPEFFMGGGGGFSTPRDYMAFLRMLLNGGTHKGVRVLKPETVASMMRNQIGDLDVHAMRTAQPAYSQSFDQFPDEPHKWGYSFDINTLPGPNGRSAGSISWAGLLNCYFWLDPVRKVTGAIFTQLLPFYDQKVVKLYGTFERGLYDGLA
ncbi:class A beta-lactamase-related serine hydrolase [Mesorhizobium sp. M7A.T.Ca.TU.009.01.3.2]|uniref:serine hydrolase domain-containing protein n=1 Tax=unclassified Mesorhizobium TaxID=325217 RepID=UPI000FCBF587|nr:MULTISPECIES: serine hydrolase domain-containing protein [unclassified Mesorhizobium]RUU23564.1 class A beta-lactamase-related serine hydrolase [Mesorhizobium sp. M7A.T.Ca.TU.009.01.3.2]RUV14008.1 class A beta-lactamase-related serine hydrolase [Mesorhizobium sp. M7A.T.Ca.TU.009.01.3.1]RUV23775.1 class A beta-lactamase-related serine hydrolase [Mesorhizobium sp. M7A.F.Ca.MR.245.00.0.0]RWN26796.1 MAG: class A beta-lactamase-related serine hydrolase [Mesorhizobium sp.]TPK33893.1 beta-lactamas